MMHNEISTAAGISSIRRKGSAEGHHRGWNDIARQSRHRLVPRYIFRDRSDVIFAFSEHDLPLPPVTRKSHFPRETIDAYRSMGFERVRRSTLTAVLFSFRERLKGEWNFISFRLKIFIRRLIKFHEASDNDFEIGIHRIFPWKLCFVIDTLFE